MKLKQDNLKTFLRNVEHVHQDTIPRLRVAAKAWLDSKEYEYGQDTVAYRRTNLVSALDTFREEIAELYDYMAERGLRDVDAIEESRIR